MPTLTPVAVPAGTLARTVQPTISADGGLVLRPWTAADAGALVGLYADPAIEYWHSFTIGTADEAGEVIGRWREGWLAESSAHWAVTTSGGAVVGRVGLLSMSLRWGTGECLYSTAPAVRGQGVAVRAVKALSQWSFGIGLHRIELRHSLKNPASCRVAAKAGFAAEGTARGAERHADGWHDMHLHARIAADR